MKSFLRAALAWLLAAAASYTLGSVAATWHVLGQVENMGLPVDAATHLRSTLHDIVGMAGSYLPLILVGLAIAFPVAAGLTRLAKGGRTALFMAAGAAALAAVNLGMFLAFDMNPIAATRTVPGLLLQCAAGAAGGWLFTRLRPAAALSSPAG